MAVQYTAIRGPNQETRREARAQISTPARESLNAKLSWQKLMLVLAANFRSTDIIVTLGYRDADLPRTREAADKRLDYFIRNLRAHRKARGQELIYARATEGYHGDGRLHHHLIINSTGDDYELIRELWKRDGENVEFTLFGSDGPDRWAKYMTKEPRTKGRRHVGDRTWRTSRNVRKPVTKWEYVPAETELLPPAGAKILDKAECHNCYGHFYYMMVQLPENLN